MQGRKMPRGKTLSRLPQRPVRADQLRRVLTWNAKEVLLQRSESDSLKYPKKTASRKLLLANHSQRRSSPDVQPSRYNPRCRLIGGRHHQQRRRQRQQIRLSGEDGGTEGSATPPEHSSGVALEATYEGDKHCVAPGTNVDKAAVDDDATAASKLSTATREGGQGATDAEMTEAGAIALKRARETPDSTANVDTLTTGEPPTKTAIGRRPTFKPRPNLPPDHRGTQTSPPP
ncbi:hypothetical protein HPB50_015252 [Hyalomma asiaticum]|uniref:Uncharacterized protein n=1 Tax=Hyalomma asiaticum TaxID=266040 RepID=A0ACB7S039_HYAAI|nr:hypothetical protein HPB50_015252 [Hyalomma asiaticum]